MSKKKNFWTSFAEKHAFSVYDSSLSSAASMGAKNTALTVTVGRDSYAREYCEANGIDYAFPDNLDWLND